MPSERRLRVLLLARDDRRPDGFAGVLHHRLSPEHDLRWWDPAAPARAQLAGVDVVLDVGTHPDGGRVLRAADRLRLWQVNGTGHDHLDLPELARRGVALAVCPGATGAQAVGEHALALLLALTRRLPEAEAAFRAGSWQEPAGGEVGGSVVSVVGLGASGRVVATALGALGAHVVAVTRRPPDPLPAGVSEAVGVDRLDDVLPRSAAVLLHVPLTEQTRGLLDRRRLALLPRGAHVVNVARGGVLDEQAALAALRAGRLGGLGLDVFATEPVTDPETHPGLNLVRTAHVAGRTPGTAARRAEVVADNLARLAAGLPPLHGVPLAA